MKLLNGIQAWKKAFLNRRPNRRTQRTPIAPRSAEIFEARQLMAAAMATAVVAQATDGTATNSQPKDFVIDAGKDANDGKADTIEAKQNGDQVEIYVNGQLTQTLSRDQIRSLTLKGSKDSDRLDASGIHGFGVTLDGGGGNDELIGGDGNDLLKGGNGKDTLNGGYGDDQILGGKGDDSLLGGVGNDRLNGEDGNDTVKGEDGNDTLTGGKGDDDLHGGDGGYSGYPTREYYNYYDVVEESGNVNFAASTYRLKGLGDDILIGIEGLKLTGGAGSNVIDASQFAPERWGGGVTLEGGGGADRLIGSLTVGNTLSGGEGADTLIGGRLGDSLNGGKGADVLRGGEGDDLLTGGAGNDVIDGGEGIDKLQEEGNVNFVLTNTSLTGLGNDRLKDMDRALLKGGDGNNRIDASSFAPEDKGQTYYGSPGFVVRLEGGGGNDVLIGTGFDDVLIGGAGNDILKGNAGDDQLQGGSGNDQINGGAGNDTLIESADADFQLTDTSLISVGNDSLDGVENVVLVGGVGNNRLDASRFTGSVTLIGGAGDDTLWGGSGNDYLNGGEGNDLIDGGAGDDQIGNPEIIWPVYSWVDWDRQVILIVPNANWFSTSIDAISWDYFNSTAGDDTISGGEGNDTIYAGAGNDLVSGNAGNDSLFGESGDDTIEAGDGNDTVYGGLGNDSIDGGSGNDLLKGGNYGEWYSKYVPYIPQEIVPHESEPVIDNPDLPDLEPLPVSVEIDRIEVDYGNDTVVGGAGDDSLDGGAGTDFLDGGEGADSLTKDPEDTAVGEPDEINEVFRTFYSPWYADLFSRADSAPSVEV